MISNKIAVQEILRQSKAFGVSDVVLSPGSRNAPFVLSFTADDFFKCHQVIDERSAGFFALGIALKKKKPVILSCTSGSAALNYAPAVLEAYNQGVPLLVITSDRPSYGYEIGEGQCFNQQFCYANFIQYQAQLDEDEHADKSAVFQAIEESFNVLIKGNGPVHLNVAFEEPLYGLVDMNTPVSNIVEEPQDNTGIVDYTPWINKWKTFSSKLTIVSQNAPEGITDKLVKLQEIDSSVYVIQENLSNTSHPKLNSCIDRTLKPLGSQLEAYAPELIVTIGNNIVSKVVKHVFRDHQPKAHWSFNNHLEQNTFKVNAEHFTGDVSIFLDQLISLGENNPSHYRDSFEYVNKEIKQYHDFNLEKIPFSDLKAFEIILNHLPSCDLHLGNSSVVRYAQLFDARTDISYYGNRGISGIEGCSSTAVGFALYNDEPTVLITGDLSFFYDSNAFWNESDINLLVIVINNGGGSIFKIIDGPKSNEKALKYFVGSHIPSVKDLCKLHGINYDISTSEKQLTNYLTTFKNNGISVLEVDTRNSENEQILSEYFKGLSVDHLIADRRNESTKTNMKST